MTGSEANALVFLALGAAIWLWVLKDYPRAVLRARDPRLFQRILVVIGVGFAAVGLSVVIESALNGHTAALATASALTLAHVLFTIVFVRRLWS